VKSIEKDHDDHEGHKKHHDHHSNEHHEHEKHHDHDKHHDDDQHATEGGHKDVILEAHLECQDIKALKQISVNAFETLDELQSLDVDLVTDQGAQEFLLNRNNTVITF
jgi:ABC-type Zn2+ transport system substrate-binding protein/surface adhesin